MNSRKWKPRHVAERSGVSPRMVAYVIKGERSCTLEIAEQLAGAFGFQVWHLLLPGIADNLFRPESLQKLYENYISSQPDGRKLISDVAEREAKYATSKKAG